MTPAFSNFKKNVQTQLAIITFLLLFVFQFSLAQTVWTVDNRPQSGAQYTTVQAAIDAASPGDIIYIHPSADTYGSVNITKTITLVGSGHDPANFNGIRSTLIAITLGNNTYPDVSGTVLTGLNCSSISAYSFGTDTDDVHVINNRITGTVSGYFNGTASANWTIEGNYFDSSASSNNIDVRSSDNWNIRNNIFEGQILNLNHTSVITNNLFINADTTGPASVFVSVGGVTSPIVTNNMFIFTDPDVTDLTNTGGTAVTYTNCLTWKSGGGAALALIPGSGNLDNTNPLFTNIPTNLYDFYNNDYTLQGGSPAEAPAGTDLTELGIFGRNFPYDIHGRPHSMPYPELMTILNTVVQPGQNLNVDFQATQKN